MADLHWALESPGRGASAHTMKDRLDLTQLGRHADYREHCFMGWGPRKSMKEKANCFSTMELQTRGNLPENCFLSGISHSNGKTDWCATHAQGQSQSLDSGSSEKPKESLANLNFT